MYLQRILALVSVFINFSYITPLYSSSRGLCPLPRITNGLAKLRQRGRLVRYQCNFGFSLIGSQYAGCSNNQWDNPVPICVKRGCSRVDRPHGKVFLFENGATANLFCETGYEEAGAKIAYCNGKEWDRAVGNCRETGVGPSTWCDFDSPRICGWTSDSTHDFDWQQKNGGSKNSLLKFIRTGPKHDHTTMKPLEGYFMVAETLGHKGNDLARLISPLYPPEKSVEACFRFYYYMYGRQLGRLRLYVKPVSVDLEEVLNDSRHILFEQIGSSENLWKEEIININQHIEEFQIVLEASAGYSIFADIAIDDVALLSGSECLNEREMTTPQQEEESGGVYDMQSCTNRCNETKSMMGATDEETISSGNGQGGILIYCDCFDGCEEKQTCCADYRRLCVFEKSTELPDDPEPTDEAFIITEPQAPLETTTKSSTKPTLPQTTSTTTKPTTTKPTTTKLTTIKPTTTTTKAPTLPSKLPATTLKTTFPPKTTPRAKPNNPQTSTSTPKVIVFTKASTISTTIASPKTTVKPSATSTEVISYHTEASRIVEATIASYEADNSEWHTPDDEATDPFWPIFWAVFLVVLVAIGVLLAVQRAYRNGNYEGGSRCAKEEVRYLIEEDNVDL